MANAFFCRAPAGMTRSTLNLTVLDRGLRGKVMHMKHNHLSYQDTGHSCCCTQEMLTILSLTTVCALQSLVSLKGRPVGVSQCTFFFKLGMQGNAGAKMAANNTHDKSCESAEKALRRTCTGQR